MADPHSTLSGVAERYAAAFFDLALEESALDAVEEDLRSLQALLDESAELKRLVFSPVFSAEEQERAIGAVADRAGVSGLTGNLVRLLARNRRLFALSGVIAAYLKRLADHRGEVTAEIVSAAPLTDAQTDEIKAALKERLGKDVAMRARVDPAILGGLVVRVGSRMIDTSIRTKLTTMKAHLKGIG